MGPRPLAREGVSDLEGAREVSAGGCKHLGRAWLYQLRRADFTGLLRRLAVKLIRYASEMDDAYSGGPP